MLRKKLAVMTATIGAVLIGLLTLGSVAAQDDPSARRSFDPAPVAAGVPVVVTITVSGTARGVVTETLPSGMEYVSSSLPSTQVRLVGQDVHFILVESADSPFTYTVTASQTGSISGELTVDQVPYGVLGVSRVTVEAGSVAAQDDPSARRSFDPAPVAAGVPVVVTITVSGTARGVVTETLPSGMEYEPESSSLPSGQVRLVGQDIHFILVESADSPFTYTVTASQTGSISGELTVDRVPYGVLGVSRVTVEAGSVAAQDDPSARRSFDPAPVAAGVPVVVTITVSGTARGVVTETLPSGMEYEPESSSLPSGQVRLVGQDIHFILVESADSPFTYTVTASQTGSISGELTVDRVPYRVLGVSTVTVRTRATTTPTGGGGGGGDDDDGVAATPTPTPHGHGDAHGSTHGDAGTHGSTHGDAGTHGSTHGDAGTDGSTHGDAGAHGSTHGDAGAHGSTHGDAGAHGSTHGDAGAYGSTHGDAGAHGSTHGDAGAHGSTHGDAGAYGSTPGGAPGGAGR